MAYPTTEAECNTKLDTLQTQLDALMSTSEMFVVTAGGVRVDRLAAIDSLLKLIAHYRDLLLTFPGATRIEHDDPAI